MHPLLPKLLYINLLILSWLLGHQAAAQTANCNAPVIITDKTTICSGEVTTLIVDPTPSYTVTSWEWFRDLDGDGIFEPVPNSNASSLSVSEGGVYFVAASAACTPPGSNRITISVTERPSEPIVISTPGSGAICGGTEVTFSLQAPEPGVEYVWQFGDGSLPATGTSVTHTYTAFGTGTEFFTLSVEAIRQPGSCRTVATEQIEVKQNPEIAFEEENDFTVCLPDTIEPGDTTVVAKLRNLTQEPYLSNIAEYFIDWGDGNGEVRYSGQPNLFPSEGPAYTEFGSFPIRIRAVGTNGCEATFEQTFVYSQEPKANFTFNKEPAGTPSSCTPVIVSLGDSSTGADLTYQWEIIDQNNIGGYNVIFGGLDQDTLRINFDNPGVFQIQLIVENGCGTDTTQQSVVVGFPQAQLSGQITACGDTTIKYSAQNVFFDPNFGNTVSYEWYVDGRLASSEQYPEFQFQARSTPYNVEVKIINECGSSDDLGQQQPPQMVMVNPLPANPVVQGVTTCAGDSVTLRTTSAGANFEWFAQATGGTPIGTGLTFTTPILNQTTTFFVQTISDQGCASERVPVTVTVVPAIDNNTVTPPVQSICVGDAPAPLTGSEPTGGVGTSYIYTWQVSTTSASTGFTAAPGVNNTQNYSPAAVGQTTWFRRVVGSGGCTADTSAAVQIDVVPRIENNTISESQRVCEGQAPDQLIGSRPTGGNGVAYNFTWEESTEGPATGFVAIPGANAENYSPGVLTQDTWFRRVVESGGCRVVSDPVMITVNDALADNNISESQEICTGTVPEPLVGSAPTGGSGSYTYLWESSVTGPNAGFSPAPGTNDRMSYTPGRLSQTTWFRRIVSSEGCDTLVSTAVEITINPGVRNNVITTNQTSVCTGQSADAIRGNTPTGGTGTYTYLWESSTIGPNAGFVQASGDNTGQDYTPEGLNQDTWFRRIAFSAGCSDTSEVVGITVNPVPAAPELSARDARACINSFAVLSVANPDGGEYRWYTNPTGGAPVFIGETFQTPNLTQSVTYYVEAVNDNECASPTRTAATVTVVIPTADAGDDVTIIQGRTVELRASGGATYLWEPAEGLSDPNVPNPIARPQETTTYTVTVTTAEGCVATDEVTVEVIPALGIPNAFTPNRDGVNEIWELENIENYPDVRVEIFNRWGNLIFTSNGYGTPWDGTYNGEELPVATYYYMIYLNSSEKPISGNVTIIR